MEQNITLQIEAGRLIRHLDEAVRKFEATWGVNRLQELAPPELREKWDRQWQKTGDAVCAIDLENMRAMVDGSIRGLLALESAAVAAGHKPYHPDFWEAQEATTGQIYRIVRNLNDAAAISNPGTITYTLEEVVNILQKSSLVEVVERRQEVEKKSPPKPRKKINWDMGEDVPF